MRENEYQAQLIKRIMKRIPDCVVMKNDPQYQQGIPDLTILNNDKWAMLEVKISEHAPDQANQDYFIKKFFDMSYAARIYPENEEEILNALQQALAPRRRSRVSES